MDEERTSGHDWIQYGSALCSASLSRKVAASALNYLGDTDFSVSKWRRQRDVTITWTDRRGGVQRTTFRFDEVVDYLRKHGRWVPNDYGFPPLESRTLESDFTLGHDIAPRQDHTGTLRLATQLPFGADFPLKPNVDREGCIFTSFQRGILQSIMTNRRLVVANSVDATKADFGWVNHLRGLFVDCLSAVEITLHQLYFLAEYRPKPGWVFDQSRLGVRHGRRVADKLRWVGMITGRPLDDAREELASLHALRELRNHLNHFDPPCFAFSVEEVVNWLNLVSDIGGLLWKIRIRMGEPLSADLIEVILARPTVFVPKNPARERHDQLATSGWASSRF